MLRDCRIICPPPIEPSVSFKVRLAITFSVPKRLSMFIFSPSINNFPRWVPLYRCNHIGIWVSDPLPRGRRGDTGGSLIRHGIYGLQPALPETRIDPALPLVQRW